MIRETIFKPDWEENKTSVTISINRVSIKTSTLTTLGKLQRIEKFVNNILNEFQKISPVQTVRGKITEYNGFLWVTLYKNKKRKGKRKHQRYCSFREEV